MTPIPSVDAAVLRHGMIGRYELPKSSKPVLFRLGPPPTPVSFVLSAETAEAVFLFLYEPLGDLTFVTIDKKTHSLREHTIPGTKITYSAIPDRIDPDILWISTCEPARVYRFNAATNELKQLCQLDGDTHIFSMDQLADGSVILGTYPQARCLRLTFDNDRSKLQQVKVDRALVCGRRYLHGVFAAGHKLLLHYGSPGRLVEFDWQSRHGHVLWDAPEPFFGFTKSPHTLTVTAKQKTWHFNRSGERIEIPSKAEEKQYQINVTEASATLTHRGHTIPISLLPRQGGSQITAFAAGKDGVIYGGTYWNHWLFCIGKKHGEVEGLGALPNASGEFFTHGWLGNQLAIPNYQGVLYLYDPSRKFDADANPRIAARVPDAHFGLACVTDSQQRLIYSTHPNYHQPGGMLVSYQPNGDKRVWQKIGDDLTLGCLALSQGRLFGGTVPARGLGLAAEKAAPADSPRVLLLDETQQAIRSQIKLEQNAGKVVDLHLLADGRVLAATKRGLYEITAKGSQLDAAPLSDFHCYRTICRCSISRVISYGEEIFLVLAPPFLFAFDERDSTISPLCRLPVRPQFLALDNDRNAYFATQNEIFYLSAAALRKLVLP